MGKPDRIAAAIANAEAPPQAPILFIVASMATVVRPKLIQKRMTTGLVRVAALPTELRQ